MEKIKRFLDSLPDDYNVIITSDHGGHGTDLPEDMTIPVIAFGSEFEAREIRKKINIFDIAPTITKLFKVSPDGDWEGKSII